MSFSGLRRFLYYPTRLPADAPLPRHAAGAEEVFLRTADGEQIHGLYWPPPPGRPVMLYLHGNAQCVFEWSLVREELGAMEVGLFLVDYRGYGKSSGQPSEDGLYRDGEAALAWLGEKGFADGDIVLLGKSLGGGVATEIARGRPLRGVILESTFTSIPAVANALFPFLPVGVLMPDRFESLQKLGQLAAPLLVVHGGRDSLIPVREGQALFDAAPEPKELWIVPGADHNDVSWVAGRAYGERLRQWLDRTSAEEPRP